MIANVVLLAVGELLRWATRSQGKAVAIPCGTVAVPYMLMGAAANFFR